MYNVHDSHSEQGVVSSVWELSLATGYDLTVYSLVKYVFVPKAVINEFSVPFVIYPSSCYQSILIKMNLLVINLYIKLRVKCIIEIWVNNEMDNYPHLTVIL